MPPARRRLPWGALWASAPWAGPPAAPPELQPPAEVTPLGLTVVGIPPAAPVPPAAGRRRLLRMPFGALLAAAPWAAPAAAAEPAGAY